MKRLFFTFILMCAMAGLLVSCVQEEMPHTHFFTEWTLAQGATCTQKGEEKSVCTCGEELTREIAATGEHVFGEWQTVPAATCVAGGEKKRVCDCGAVETRDIPATGEHTFGEWQTVTAATCVAGGEEKRVCDCGAVEMRDIPATGEHSFGEWQTLTAATCVASGEEKRACDCGALEKRNIPATGEHIYQNWLETTPATCAQTGVETGTCSCGATDTRTVARMPHSYTGWQLTAAPSCTEKGEEARVCACGDRQAREVATVPHSYGAWSVIRDATCGADGEEKQSCQCGAFETRRIPATGVHSYGKWQVAVAPTCSEKGEEARVCACGDRQTREVSCIPHEYGVWAVTSAASCGSVGEEKRTCACGAFEAREIPATGAHQYGEWHMTKPASCLKNGEEKRSCACGAAQVRETTAGHSYNAENTCDTCGDYKDKGVVFTLQGEAYAVSNYTGNAAEVILPSQYRGKPVRAIGENAFCGCLSLTSVRIPASVVSIGKGAFRADSHTAVMHLERVSFAENSQLESIGDRAFYLCTNLKSITLPRTLKSIGDYAFAGDRGEYSWEQCEHPMALARVDLAADSALESIGNGAFQYCVSLTAFTVPKTVKRIDYEAFFGCTALTSVHFENANGWELSRMYATSNKVTPAASVLGDPATASAYLTGVYCEYCWKRTQE